MARSMSECCIVFFFGAKLKMKRLCSYATKKGIEKDVKKKRRGQANIDVHFGGVSFSNSWSSATATISRTNHVLITVLI